MPGFVIARLTCVWPDGTLPPTTPLQAPNIQVPIGCDGVVQLDFVSGNGVALDVSDALIVFSAGPRDDGSPFISRTTRPDPHVASRCYVDIYQADSIGWEHWRFDCSIEVTIDTIRQAVTKVGLFELVRTVGTISSPTDPSIPAAPFSRISKLVITQPMLDAGVPVVVPVAFVPTAAIGSVAGGMVVNNLITVDGSTAQVTVAMSDGVNLSPFTAGDVVIITAIQ